MTTVVYHRCYGKSLGLPPNALSSAKWAVDNGARAIEYDIFYGADNGDDKIIVIEPKLLQKAGLNPDALQWNDIAGINVGNDAKTPEPPTDLIEFLKAIPETVSQQIHIKSRHPKTIPTLLKNLAGRSNVIITSFTLADIEEVKRLSPVSQAGWLVPPGIAPSGEGLNDLTKQISEKATSDPYTPSDLALILQHLAAAKPEYVMLCAPRLKDEEQIAFFRSQNYKVGAWGIGDNRGLAEKLLQWKIDRFTFDVAETLRAQA
jgi:glycerophosphoryl diester phosphodiesterase